MNDIGHLEFIYRRIVKQPMSHYALEI